MFAIFEDEVLSDPRVCPEAYLIEFQNIVQYCVQMSCCVHNGLQVPMLSVPRIIVSAHASSEQSLTDCNRIILRSAKLLFLLILF